MVSLTNVIYLQAAPTAFASVFAPHPNIPYALADHIRNVGWKFYLLFIILSFIGGCIFLFCFPDTRGLPLEEIAALFGDSDEVAIYQRDIEIDANTMAVIDHHDEKKAAKPDTEHVEV